MANAHLVPGDESWPADRALLSELTPVIAQLSQYVMRYFDADAGRVEPLTVLDERALAERVAEVAAKLHDRAQRRAILDGLAVAVEVISSHRRSNPDMANYQAPAWITASKGHGWAGSSRSSKPLTPEEKLLAGVIALSQKIPCGGQIFLGSNLDSAMERVEEFFTEHKLPLKDELLGELQLWREHAEQGLKFSQQCDLLMQKIVQLVDGMVKQ